MELWLLGAGAIVLVAITLWIVWPARTAEPIGNSTQGKEVLDNPMIDNNERSGLSPSGEQLDDHHPSTAADSSPSTAAGAGSTAWVAPGAATTPATPATPAPSGPAYTPPAQSQPWTPPAGLYDGGPEPRTIGLGAGILLSIGAALGGAWLYARWQRKRNTPINRLRRGARDMGSRLGERIPDVDDLAPSAAPMSGAAAALLLSGLLATRFLRRNTGDRAEQAGDAVRDALEYGTREAKKRGRDAFEHGGRQAIERGRDAAKLGSREAKKRGRDAFEQGSREAARHGRRGARQLASSKAADQLAEQSKAGGKRLGLLGMSVMGAGSYLVWRLTHRD